MKLTFSDSYKIYPVVEVDTSVFPELDDYFRKATQLSKWMIGHPYATRWKQAKESKAMNVVKALLHSTRGTVTMKMLLAYADGKEHHFKEMAKACGIQEDTDIDCWKSLVNRNLISFSSKHQRGSKYYTITNFGRFITNVIEANDVFYKTIRWFKNIDDDQIYAKMMTHDLNTNGYSFDDISPESCLKLVQSLLDESSMLFKLGSVCKWMNAFMYVLKSSRELYNHINIPEINEWLDANKELNYATKAFYPKWKRIQKMWLKKTQV